MVRIKICGITNLGDAVACVESGADILGFNFYEGSPRYIPPEQARLIIEEVPDSVLAVGIFVNVEDPREVARVARLAGVGAVQLHGDEPPEYCRSLGDFFVIKALRVGEDFAPARAAAFDAGAILLDAFSPGARGGTGETFDWRIARRTSRVVKKLFLAGGLSPENVAGAVAAVRPYAVDACSSLEVMPGRKDAGRVREFVAAARRRSDQRDNAADATGDKARDHYST
jgi:phosphoribosylanthranilate isomerase